MKEPNYQIENVVLDRIAIIILSTYRYMSKNDITYVERTYGDVELSKRHSLCDWRHVIRQYTKCYAKTKTTWDIKIDFLIFSQGRVISSLVPKAFRLQARKIILAIGRPQEPGLGDFFNKKLQRPLIPLPRFPLLWQVTRPSKHCKHSRDSRQRGQWPAESAITWHYDNSYAPLMPRKILVVLKYEMYLAHNMVHRNDLSICCREGNR